MSKKQSPVTILLAEDDPDDRMVVQEAFDENNWARSTPTPTKAAARLSIRSGGPPTARSRCWARCCLF